MPITDAWRKRFEREFAKALAAFFAGQQRGVVNAAKEGEIATTDPVVLRKTMEPWLIAAAVKGSEVAMEPIIAIGLGFDTLLVNEAAVRYAQERAAQAVTQIDGTTRRMIQQKVSQWFESGGTLKELTESLAPTFGYDRAEMIAVTEVTDTLAGSAEESWREVNRQYGTAVVEGKVWHTAADERVCPICAPLDGQVVGLNEDFVHPGGSGLAARYEGRRFKRPPAHPRGRCTVGAALLRDAKR